MPIAFNAVRIFVSSADPSSFCASSSSVHQVIDHCTIRSGLVRAVFRRDVLQDSHLLVIQDPTKVLIFIDLPQLQGAHV